MAQGAMTAGQWKLVMPAGLYQRLHDHVFPGDGDEHGAVIAAGVHTLPDGGVRLLARDLFLAEDGVDYVPGKRGYRMLKAQFIQRQISRCRDEKLAYLAVHNHGRGDAVSFSPDDRASHRRGYPALLDIAKGQPVGALVLASEAIAGEIWLPDGSQIELTHTEVIGRRRTILRPAPSRRTFERRQTYDRQARLFGDRGQAVLAEAKVAIVGVGGVGSLLAEYLGRLGVGRFVIIDPDRISPSNLPRVVGASGWDVLSFLRRPIFGGWLDTLADRFSTLKVDIAELVIRQANPSAEILKLDKTIEDQDVALRLLDCDYIFLAADTMMARLIFNQIIHQYYIPGVQVGSKISTDKSSGAVTNVFSAVRPVTPEHGCLWCNQLINPAKLQEELQTSQERRAQRYVDEPEVVAPSVITLNAVGAAHAANDFLFYMTGLAADDGHTGYLRDMPVTRKVWFDEPRKDAECPECGKISRSRLARGSSWDLSLRRSAPAGS